MDMRADLLKDIQAFVIERKIAETTFGRLAVNDGKFVPRLRSGSPVGLDLAQRAQNYMRAEQARIESSAQSPVTEVDNCTSMQNGE